jgi:hypothetical protein
MDKLMFAGMLILIFLSALQLRKISRIYRQMTSFLDKLTGYLKVVLEDTEEEAGDESQAEFAAQGESDAKKVERQVQQKKARDAQVFDAILSEIYP